MKKKCFWCNNFIDEAYTGVFPIDAVERGKHIYFAIMDGKGRSTDLCNLDYSLLQYYRIQNPVFKCRNIEESYGKQIIEDNYNN